MNKKLKIYSTLLIVALVIFSLTYFFNYSSYTSYSTDEEELKFVECPPEFMSTDTLPNNSGIVTHRLPYVGYSLNIEPKNLPNQKVLITRSDGQIYRLNPQKINLEMPGLNKLGSFPMVFIVSAAVFSAIVAILILWMVGKLVWTIYKGQVFVAKVSKYMERAGILLCLLYLFDVVVLYCFTQYMIAHVNIPGYYIVFKNTCNSMFIITGLALMIISQIILMGKDLKDEQELTI